MGHVQDRWYTSQPDPDNPTRTVRVPTARHGKGQRYKARMVGPDGNEVSQTFADGQLKLARDWLARQQVDLALGTFVDPRAGKVTIKAFAERWLADADPARPRRPPTRIGDTERDPWVGPPAP